MGGKKRGGKIGGVEEELRCDADERVKEEKKLPK